ncbi:MAG: hypothetical protein K2X11_22260 [Acetobacteraceae bacterium]|nr:hypothetical protein [Acetobacteraceae bacterium]
MRRLALASLCLVLPACDGPALVATGGVTVASLTLFGRAPADVLVSGATGRDCSIVRLDRGLSYCAPPEAPPEPAPYCTRSLGRVDCWVTPPAAIPLARGVADGPSGLTPAQEARRSAPWPRL